MTRIARWIFGASILSFAGLLIVEHTAGHWAWLLPLGLLLLAAAFLVERL